MTIRPVTSPSEKRAFFNRFDRHRTAELREKTAAQYADAATVPAIGSDIGWDETPAGYFFRTTPIKTQEQMRAMNHDDNQGGFGAGVLFLLAAFFGVGFLVIGILGNLGLLR